MLDVGDVVKWQSNDIRETCEEGVCVGEIINIWQFNENPRITVQWDIWCKGHQSKTSTLPKEEWPKLVVIGQNP